MIRRTRTFAGASQRGNSFEPDAATCAPGARVAASGSKLLPRWLAPANVLVRRMNGPYLTTFTGLRRPWRHLAEYVPDLAVRTALWGAGYVAYGRYRPRGSTR